MGAKLLRNGTGDREQLTPQPLQRLGLLCPLAAPVGSLLRRQPGGRRRWWWLPRGGHGFSGA
ncbi:MAG: hypothetical protein ACK559_04660 [bacterium]